MTEEEFKCLYEEKCKHCQKLIHDSWCVEHGHHGCNPWCAIIQCSKQKFKPFKQKVEEE